MKTWHFHSFWIFLIAGLVSKWSWAAEGACITNDVSSVLAHVQTDELSREETRAGDSASNFVDEIRNSILACGKKLARRLVLPDKLELEARYESKIAEADFTDFTPRLRVPYNWRTDFRGEKFVSEKSKSVWLHEFGHAVFRTNLSELHRIFFIGSEFEELFADLVAATCLNDGRAVYKTFAISDKLGLEWYQELRGVYLTNPVADPSRYRDLTFYTPNEGWAEWEPHILLAPSGQYIWRHYLSDPKFNGHQEFVLRKVLDAMAELSRDSSRYALWDVVSSEFQPYPERLNRKLIDLVKASLENANPESECAYNQSLSGRLSIEAVDPRNDSDTERKNHVQSLDQAIDLALERISHQVAQPK